MTTTKIGEMSPEDLKIRRALVFAILMQNGDGVMTKSAGYIQEKWDAVQAHDHPCVLLDHTNKTLFEIWLAKWRPNSR